MKRRAPRRNRTEQIARWLIADARLTLEPLR